MSFAPYRVGMSGSSTLLGKEILSVLKERQFPLTHVSALAEEPPDPQSPVLDISGEAVPVLEESEPGEAECDFVFLADAAEGRDIPHRKQWCFVIDARQGPGTSEEAVLWTSPLESDAGSLTAAARAGASVFAAPHPAAITVGSLLLRLSASLEIQRVSATIFNPASAIGPAAIEELQKQTVGLLNFGAVPREVFGAESAFNLLPRLTGNAQELFAGTESRIRKDVERILAGRAPLPALQMLQTPVFYSTACSIYLQASPAVGAIQVEQSLGSEGIRWIPASAPASAPADIQGSPLFFMDPVRADPSHPGGFWLCTRVDDLRLAAESAVAIAERLVPFIVRS